MADDKLLTGLIASDLLNEIFSLMDESVKTARAPIDIGDWDVVTVRGELRDLQDYLRQAVLQLQEMRGSYLDLVALIGRLRTAYHLAYMTWQKAHQEAEDAFHKGETKMLGRFITDVNDELAPLLLEVCQTFDQLSVAERTALAEKIRQMLRHV